MRVRPVRTIPLFNPGNPFSIVPKNRTAYTVWQWAEITTPAMPIFRIRAEHWKAQRDGTP